MLRNKREKSRREEILQKKYDILAADYQTMEKERDRIRGELETYKAKLEAVEKTEEDLMTEIAKVKSARIQYESAFRELNILRASYSSEVNKLIKEMER